MYILTCLMILFSTVHGMDREEKRQPSALQKKYAHHIRFISNTFTSPEQWKTTLRTSSPVFHCRFSTSEFVPVEPIEPWSLFNEMIRDHIREKKLERTTPTIMIHNEGRTAFTIACANRSVVQIDMLDPEEPTISYYEKCHDAAIVALECIGDDFLLIGGGNSITFQPQHDTAIFPFRVALPRDAIVDHLGFHKNRLIVTTEDKHHLMLYPYHQECYNYLRGRDNGQGEEQNLNEKTLKLLWKAARATVKNDNPEWHVTIDDLTLYYAALPIKMRRIVENHTKIVLESEPASPTHATESSS